MDTIKVEHGNVRMVAHRGVSGLEMENTCAAFVAAGNRSYYGIETDVHVTADKQIAVIHDNNTKRISGTDLCVEESTLEQLQAIPLYDRVSDTSRTDLRIPVLADYINICKRYGKISVLELKSRMEPEDIALIVKIIKELDYLDNVIFISFSWENLIDLKALVPDQKAQFLTGECTEELIQKLVENRLDLDISYPGLTKELVDRLHANHIEINCWTVDQKEDAERLISWGVDYITSNILE